MSHQTADVVICGAGIAGISAAYYLTRDSAVKDVLLVDEGAPLSLTSDKSTECYRNWWPGPGDAMVSMMNRSIDILDRLADESGNIFHLNRRGYLFATTNAERINDFREQAEQAASFGAGPLRIHDGVSGSPSYTPASIRSYQGQPTGADLITDLDLIVTHFPYLAKDTVAVIHPRRCGWFSAQQLGMYMLERARQNGARLIQGRVDGVQVSGGRVAGVEITGESGTQVISTRHFINAAGPHLKSVGRLIGVDLPVFSELHAKISIRDREGAFPREAPLLIWSDPQALAWTEEEREMLNETADTRFMLDPFPQGVHARAEGPVDSPIVLILWTYHAEQVSPTFPIEYDPFYPEIALRGLARMLPALDVYIERPPKPHVDGGYYTKTEENRPLVGPLPVEGAWVMGALSGFGVMASPACGELLSKYIAGTDLPHYAPWFHISRYEDPEYQELLKSWEQTGQL
ncbi:MAG: FAD-binding oxidoreductase [Anaerolineales bacterium]|nr:FAD-binding oxidoreductase [Anaerolineales bacterium]